MTKHFTSMENEPRKRVARSSKPGKKDGKSVKEAQAAAEEARRREAVRETLREKLDLEKRALQVVERLLEDSVADDFLVDCARLITAANYKDTVEERSIVKLCGYPVCSNKLGKVSTQQFKISTKTNKVYDITERKSFCSNFCYKASKSFELQISKSPLWLRQHESPPDVKLMKKGDGGSTGEEVRLAERRLREDDVENPIPLDSVSPEAPEDPRRSPTAGHSDDSDTEHDFVSSVVSQRRGPRVHWGDLPKRTAEGQGREPGEGEDKERRSGGKDTTVPNQIQTNEAEDEEENTEESQKAQRKPSNGTDGHQQHTTDTNHQSEQQSFLGERGSPEGQSMEEAAELLSQVTIQDRDPATATSPALTACSVQNQDPALNRSPQGDPAQPTQPGINITQVGMSRRGAQGLRGLLKCHEAGTKPVSVRLNLLEGLRRTFTEWMTEETMKFLYGPDHFSKTLIETKEEEEKEEELDEDDLEDIVKDGGEERETDSQGGPGRPSAPAPDYDTLRRETEEMGLRVREFYKGTKEVQRVSGKQHARDEDSENQGGALPLVDSHSQHLIQKRITVEKLTKGLRDIVGPLRLTMTDVSSDLNRLVRTFRFTNTNIIHKGPEWTLIAVVLLHLLSEVSPVVREALERPASVDYLSTLMQELPLLDQDLQSLIQLLRTAELCPHEHTENRQTNQ